MLFDGFNEMLLVKKVVDWYVQLFEVCFYRSCCCFVVLGLWSECVGEGGVELYDLLEILLVFRKL